MTYPNEYADEPVFLRGGGAMGALIAGHDWAATSLGPQNAWPQSLKTTIAIVLNASVPMALMWGPDGVVLYNDAYAVLAGDRHPGLVGAKVREGWPEVADFNDQVMRTVLGGRTLVLRDFELMLNRSGQPERVWMNLDYSPVYDESGRPAGVLAIIVETTQRVIAERKAATEAARQRRMFEQAPGFICILHGPDHVFEFANDAFKSLFGYRDVVGKPLSVAFGNLGREYRAILDRVYAQGERYIGRAAPAWLKTSRDGPREERFLDFVMQPISGESGQVAGVFCMGFEVTDQVRAQVAVQDSERRLSAAVSIARLGAFEWDLEKETAMLDARAREIFGFDPDQELRIQDVTRRIDPRDLPRVRSPNHVALARREAEYRVNLPDGTTRNVVSLSDTLKGPDGKPQRVIGVFDDVTERRRAEKRQRLLINELNHRVKNTLATVQSIAAQTLRSAPDLERARESFEARLLALAAAHDLLTAESWHGARLADVVASAMAPFETERRPQVSRSGPPVWLTAQRALALSMALHELATNAVKYGALSVPEGRVTIRWSVSDDDVLTLTWLEQGGPEVAPPERAGFGSRLLQRSLARELGGDVSFDFAPDGVRCEIHCMVADANPSAVAEPIEV